MTQFFPEQTIRYKTYAKRTLVEGIQGVFRKHPDELLQRTKVTIEYPKTEADYPAIIVRFFERQVFNAGVGHQEVVFFEGESDSIEVTAAVTTQDGGVQLTWPKIGNAVGYKIYKGTAPGKETESFTVTEPVFYDHGQEGAKEAPPTIVTANLDTPDPSTVVVPRGTNPPTASPSLPGGTVLPGPTQFGLAPGVYYYKITALTPSEAVKFRHYYYTADVEFAVYALSAYDRDLVADTLVQTIAMGTLERYTNQFFERVYPSNDLYPDSDLHFININSDEIQGFGESQTQTPWGAEDDLLYMTSYRVGIFGEIYSLPPKITYAMVLHITQYPYIGGIDPIPTGNPNDDTPWVSNEAF